MPIMGAMSRLRRLVVSDRWFFVTCRLLPRRRILSELEFACLARVVHERREEQGFLLTAWAFLPDHWHAIYPFIMGFALQIKGGSHFASLADCSVCIHHACFERFDGFF